MAVLLDFSEGGALLWYRIAGGRGREPRERLTLKPGERGKTDSLEVACTPKRCPTRLLMRGAHAAELRVVARNAIVSGPECPESRRSCHAVPGGLPERERRPAPRVNSPGDRLRLLLLLLLIAPVDARFPRAAMPLSCCRFVLFPVVRLLQEALAFLALFIGEIGARSSQNLTKCCAVVTCAAPNSRIEPLSTAMWRQGRRTFDGYRAAAVGEAGRSSSGFFLQELSVRRGIGGISRLYSGVRGRGPDATV